MNGLLKQNENDKTKYVSEIERLSTVLRTKTEETSRIEVNYKTVVEEWQTKVARYQQDNDELRRRLQELSDVNRKVAEYENKLVIMQQEIERLNGLLRQNEADREKYAREIERLNGVLKSKTDENSRIEVNYKTVVEEWQTKVTRYQQDNDELRRRLQELSDVNRKVAEY